MSEDIKTTEDPSIRIGDLKFSEEDAHSRVAILFVVTPATEYNKIVLLAVSVKWLLHHGVPINPETGQHMAYNSTHIIQ